MNGEDNMQVAEIMWYKEDISSKYSYTQGELISILSGSGRVYENLWFQELALSLWQISPGRFL